ncbi:MAG: hypothetical protein WBD22_04550 [Pyrinomonadaceae bacterium]
MGLFSRFKRKDKFTDNDRIEFLRSNGRITDGYIKDAETMPNGDEVVFYVYTLNGVDFESSELLSDEQMRDPIKFAPGSKVGIRYDPRNQGNSMLD